MRSYACLGWITTAAVLGCDAKVDERYRGEPMLSITGSLVVENPNVSSDLVPALAFLETGAFDPDDITLHILDVDTQGEFPTNFTLNVMSPPPAAALRSVPSRPSYAVGYITALPEQQLSRLHTGLRASEPRTALGRLPLAVRERPRPGADE